MADAQSLSHYPLPTVRDPLVGRAAERAAARSLLLEQSVSLLTLTGPAGVGKTRLALAIASSAAEAFPGGDVFVDLSPIREPDLVLPAIGQAFNIHDTADRALPELMRLWLRSRPTLLVLDNCEQVIAAAPDIAALLAACPSLQILATSRAPLRIRGEQEFPVPPLALPDQNLPTAALTQVDSVVLFVQRARAVNQQLMLSENDLRAIAAICHRLDGLPLAIELAAARIRLFPPITLLSRLEQRLAFLDTGARDLPARQRSLRDAIAWSHDLLSGDERTLFRRLSVFVGGWTLEAAEAIANHDGTLDVLAETASLLEKNLLRPIDQAEGGSRFGMLETIREFALERLDERAADAGATRGAHADFFSDLAIAARSGLTSGVPQAVAWVRAEEDNLRAMLAHLLETGDTETALRVAGGSLLEYWTAASGRFAEGRAWLDRALRQGDAVSPAARALGLYGIAILAVHQFDLGVARQAGTEALALARAANDPQLATQCSYAMCLIEEAENRFEAAARYAAESIAAARTLNDPGLLGWALLAQGNVLWHTGDFLGATPVLQEALALFRGFGGVWGEADALTILAWVARAEGDRSRSARLHLASLLRRRDSVQMVGVYNDVVSLAGLGGDLGYLDTAARLLGAEEAYRDITGYGGFGDTPIIREQARQLLAGRLNSRQRTRAWDAGRSLSTEQAVAEAISLAETLTAGVSAPPHTPPRPFALTPREAEILRLIVAGHSNAQIAEALFISPRTATTHVSNILAKLGVETRTEAAVTAVRDGLL